VPDLPEGVEIVIERAIARNPAERFQSMTELDAALASLVKSDAPVVRHPSTDSMLAPDPTAALGRAVPSARPTIIAMTMLGVLLTVAIVTDILAWIIAAFMNGVSLDEREGTLLVVGVMAALGTPLILWVRFVWRRIWHNSLRAVGLARRLTATFCTATATYALVALCIRGFDLAVLPPDLDFAVAMLAPIAASAAAVFAGLLALLLTRQRGAPDPN
jgi:serine/threonine-protein kinase